MKKITLLFILLTASFGYSQTFPLDYEDAADNMVGDNCVFTIIVDPDNPAEFVGEIQGGGQDYDNAQIVLAESVSLADDNNNTITFRIKPVNGTGSNSHLLKWEDGTTPNTELPFTTDGTTDWQIITINFPAGLGEYPKLVIFTDFANAASDTYLIDDIAGGTNVAPPPAPEAFFPIDFSDAYELFVGAGASTSLTTDPDDATNAVMEVTSGGGDWDNAQITLAQNLDLSDDNNNTITFRINPLNGTGSNNHLLKFEQGTTAPTELPFTTTGTGWQDIILNFPGGLGNYAFVVLFTDAGTGAQDTYLVDDFAGATNIVPIADPEAAPLPNTPDGETYSIYNDTNNYTTSFPVVYSFGTLGGEPDLDPGTGVNKALKFDFSFAGWGQGEGGPDDVSGYGFVNFMYWAQPGVPGFQFNMISNAGGNVTEHTYEIGTQEAIVSGQWTQVSIPMSYFTGIGFSSTNFFQWKCDAFMQAVTNPGVVFFDNLILTQNALSVNEFDTAQFTVYPNPANSVWNVKTNNQNIISVQVFDILGKQVLSLNPNASIVTIDGSDLSKGLYVAQINVNNRINTVKLIKN